MSHEGTDKKETAVLVANNIKCLQKTITNSIDIQERQSQLTFTCSKSTIETIEKGVKYVQS